MSTSTGITRRTLLTGGAAAGLLTVAHLSAGTAASAFGPVPHRPGSGPIITDLGPGMVQYSLMSGILAGGVYFVGIPQPRPHRCRRRRPHHR